MRSYSMTSPWLDNLSFQKFLRIRSSSESEISQNQRVVWEDSQMNFCASYQYQQSARTAACHHSSFILPPWPYRGVLERRGTSPPFFSSSLSPSSSSLAVNDCSYQLQSNQVVNNLTNSAIGQLWSPSTSSSSTIWSNRPGINYLVN